MMTIRILGTAAAEGWPALFCDCEACRTARSLGGKNIRTRSSLLVDGALKIDLPPDTLMQAHACGLDLSKLEYLLFTHSHGDHLAFGELVYLFRPFALQDKGASIAIYANADSLERMKKIEEHFAPDSYGNLFHEVLPFTSFELGPYRVTAVRAVHGADADPLNYIVAKDGRRFLYTCDTGFYPEENWDFLNGVRMDAVISECTGGPNAVDYGTHLGFPDVKRFRTRAEEIGMADRNTRWILTHFSHGGGMLHDELVRLVSPHGFEVGWDGMAVEL